MIKTPMVAMVESPLDNSLANQHPYDNFLNRGMFNGSFVIEN